MVDLEVRRASAADAEPLAQMLAQAFDDDPVARWAYPPPHLRPKLLRRFQLTRLRQLLRHEEVWTDAERRTAALWAPPGHWRTTIAEDLAIVRTVLTLRLLLHLPVVGAGITAIERRHPREPHWYLAVLGTAPAAQGRGLGSAVLAPVLERCDEDGVAAYLESSKERNIDFYARHGFRVTRVIRLPRGPRVWAMWREPR